MDTGLLGGRLEAIEAIRIRLGRLHDRLRRGALRGRLGLGGGLLDHAGGETTLREVAVPRAGVRHGHREVLRDDRAGLMHRLVAVCVHDILDRLSGRAALGVRHGVVLGLVGVGHYDHSTPQRRQCTTKRAVRLFQLCRLSGNIVTEKLEAEGAGDRGHSLVRHPSLRLVGPEGEVAVLGPRGAAQKRSAMSTITTGRGVHRTRLTREFGLRNGLLLGLVHLGTNRPVPGTRDVAAAIVEGLELPVGLEPLTDYVQEGHAGGSGRDPDLIEPVGRPIRVVVPELGARLALQIEAQEVAGLTLEVRRGQVVRVAAEVAASRTVRHVAGPEEVPRVRDEFGEIGLLCLFHILNIHPNEAVVQRIVRFDCFKDHSGHEILFRWSPHL